MTTKSDTTIPKPFGASFAREMLAILLALAILQFVQPLGALWFAWYPSELNPAIAEGRAWWSGRLDIPDRILDTAYDPATGRIYNVYPPLLPIISFLAHAPLPGRATPTEFPEFLPLILFGLPLPMVGYWAFSRLTRGPWWPAIMTLCWIGGTALIGVLRLARNCDVYHLNHVLSQIGLLLMVTELLTRRRLWLMMLGLGIAAWSRQLTLLFAPAVLAAAWYELKSRMPAVSNGGAGNAGQRPARPANFKPASRRTLAWYALAIAVIVCVPMGLSWVKFGRPWRTGFELLYPGVNETLHQRVSRHGLFSTAFAAENFNYMNVDTPEWEWQGRRPRPVAHSQGISIWYTTPILALVWLGLPAWWRDPVRRAVMLCSLAVVAGHLCYHASGVTTAGYYRYVLDYAPVWLAVCAGWLTTGWRRCATVACIAWSLAYFGLLFA